LIRLKCVIRLIWLPCGKEKREKIGRERGKNDFLFSLPAKPA
jgi:hypothetical protein